MNHVQGKLADAVAHYQQALSLEPDCTAVHNNLGLVFHEQGDLEEAEACFRAALALQPRYVDAHNNLGNTFRVQGNFDAAAGCFHQAVRLQPDHVPSHLSLAFLWLQTGDFKRGWRELEWRWKSPDYPLPTFRQPLWDGAPLNGRSILLYADQGFGDTLQFIRYALLVQQRGGRVTVACQRALVRILARSPGVDRSIARDAPLPECDVYAPLMSLPRILQDLVGECAGRGSLRGRRYGQGSSLARGLGADRRIQNRHRVAGQSPASEGSPALVSGSLLRTTRPTTGSRSLQPAKRLRK